MTQQKIWIFSSDYLHISHMGPRQSKSDVVVMDS